MAHPLDALLRDVVNPVARERGYTRKGRNYFRYNDNGDAAHVNVQLLGSSTEFRIEAGISGHLATGACPTRGSTTVCADEVIAVGSLGTRG